MLVIDMELLVLTLVNVAVWAALVVPTAWLAKLETGWSELGNGPGSIQGRGLRATRSVIGNRYRLAVAAPLAVPAGRSHLSCNSPLPLHSIRRCWFG